MKTLIAFIAGLVSGAAVGIVGLYAAVLKGTETNGNGYERADR